jgi:hypothetical protein
VFWFIFSGNSIGLGWLVLAFFFLWWKYGFDVLNLMNISTKGWSFHGLRYSGSLLQKTASRVSVRMLLGFDINLSVRIGLCRVFDLQDGFYVFVALFFIVFADNFFLKRLRNARLSSEKNFPS